MHILFASYRYTIYSTNIIIMRASVFPLDDLHLDTILEVDQNGVLELQGKLHPGRVPEDVVAVEVDDD